MKKELEELKDYYQVEQWVKSDHQASDSSQHLSAASSNCSFLPSFPESFVNQPTDVSFEPTDDVCDQGIEQTDDALDDLGKCHTTLDTIVSNIQWYSYFSR